MKPGEVLSCPALFRLDSPHTVRPPSLKAADFQRALGSRPVSRTAHFVLHVLARQAPAPVHLGEPAGEHAGDAPSAVLAAQVELTELTKLSTGEGGEADVLVDDFVAEIPEAGRQAWRLGLVLPKKQAKRSVTRSLIRHQAREALRRHAPAVWAQGRHGDEVDGWVVRLRAPFDRKQFPSAASDALKALVRQELDELWRRLAAPASPSSGARFTKDSPAPVADNSRGAA